MGVAKLPICPVHPAWQATITGAALGDCLLGDAATVPLATRLSQEMTASIVFFIALGWAGDRGAFARASSSLAPIS